MVVDVAGGSLASGANIQSYTYNGTGARNFYIRYATSPDYGPTFTVQNLKSGIHMDLKGSGTSNSTNIWQYNDNGTAAQKWILHQGTHRYASGIPVIFESFVGSALQTAGLMVDVAGSRTANGTNIQGYSWNGTNAQLFCLRKARFPLPIPYHTAYPRSTVGLAIRSSGMNMAIGIDRPTSLMGPATQRPTWAGPSVENETHAVPCNRGVEPRGIEVSGVLVFIERRRAPAASLVIASGTDVKVIQQMLGHRSATMTLDLYGHLFPTASIRWLTRWTRRARWRNTWLDVYRLCNGRVPGPRNTAATSVPMWR